MWKQTLQRLVVSLVLVVVSIACVQK